MKLNFIDIQLVISFYAKVELVKKRYGKDNDFVLEASTSLEDVLAWTEAIYKEKSVVDLKIPESVWKWFLEVVMGAYKKAQNDLVRRMILVKIIHTREVVRAGFEIVSAEKKFEWNEYQVGTVCLLHDIARFEQALLGSFSDEKTGFNHAVKGGEMIETHEFDDFAKLGIDKEKVVLSVKNHSKYKYSGEEAYAKLIRDADKLALLRAMPEILASRIKDYDEGQVSEVVLKAYKEGRIVHHKDIKYRVDLFVSWLAWEFDLNFTETKRLFVADGIKGWIEDGLKSFRVVL